MCDFIGDFETESGALVKINETSKEEDGVTIKEEKWEWCSAHIYDTEKKEIIWEK